MWWCVTMRCDAVRWGAVTVAVTVAVAVTVTVAVVAAVVELD